MQGDSRKDAPDAVPVTTFSRRAIVKAGWVVPVILAVGVPRDALAMYGSDATSTNQDGTNTYDRDRYYDYRRRVRRWYWR